MAEAVLLGAHGGVNGGANIWPELYVELYKAAEARDLERTKKLHRKVVQLASSIYNVGPSGASVLQGIKTALSILGICSDVPAEPFRRLDAEQRGRIEQAVEAIGLLDAVEANSKRAVLTRLLALATSPVSSDPPWVTGLHTILLRGGERRRLHDTYTDVTVVRNRAPPTFTQEKPSMTLRSLTLAHSAASSSSCWHDSCSRSGTGSKAFRSRPSLVP